MTTFNPQHQTRVVWSPSFTVARAYVDQLQRGNGIPASEVTRITAELKRIEGISATSARRSALNALAASLEKVNATDSKRIRLLGETLKALAK
jgi:hypothetical protein